MFVFTQLCKKYDLFDSHISHRHMNVTFQGLCAKELCNTYRKGTAVLPTKKKN